MDSAKLRKESVLMFLVEQNIELSKFISPYTHTAHILTQIYFIFYNCLLSLSYHVCLCMQLTEVWMRYIWCWTRSSFISIAIVIASYFSLSYQWDCAFSCLSYILLIHLVIVLYYRDISPRQERATLCFPLHQWREMTKARASSVAFHLWTLATSLISSGTVFTTSLIWKKITILKIVGGKIASFWQH